MWVYLTPAALHCSWNYKFVVQIYTRGIAAVALVRVWIIKTLNAIYQLNINSIPITQHSDKQSRADCWGYTLILCALINQKVATNWISCPQTNQLWERFVSFVHAITFQMLGVVKRGSWAPYNSREKELNKIQCVVGVYGPHFKAVTCH